MWTVSHVTTDYHSEGDDPCSSKPVLKTVYSICSNITSSPFVVNKVQGILWPRDSVQLMLTFHKMFQQWEIDVKSVRCLVSTHRKQLVIWWQTTKPTAPPLTRWWKKFSTLQATFTSRLPLSPRVMERKIGCCKIPIWLCIPSPLPHTQLSPLCNWQSSFTRATTLSSSIPPASRAPLSHVYNED